MATSPQVTYTIDKSIYDIQPYSWDGKDRPNINNYIEPWAKYASQTEPKWNTEYNRAIKSGIAYAKNRMEAAIAQYNADLSFWQELDERDYTDPFSQSNRYKEAGYNLGYLYNQVDSGNSAVGYNDSSASFESQDTKNNLNDIETVADIAVKSLSFVTNLVRTGISLKKLPSELDLLNKQSLKSVAEGGLASAKSTYQQLQNEFIQALQQNDENGNPVSFLSQSLMFASEAISYKLKGAEFTDISKWNAVASKIYELQSTPSADKAFNDWVMSQDMPEWAKVLSIVLGSFVSKASPTMSISKRK